MALLSTFVNTKAVRAQRGLEKWLLRERFAGLRDEIPNLHVCIATNDAALVEGRNRMHAFSRKKHQFLVPN